MEKVDAKDILASADLASLINKAVDAVASVRKEQSFVTIRYLDALGNLRGALLNGKEIDDIDAREIINTSYQLIAENNSLRKRLQDALGEMVTQSLRAGQGRINFAGR